MNVEKVKNPNVIRLLQLSKSLSALQHARGRQNRDEMVKLMTEYHNLKNANRDAWDEFCKSCDMV